MKWYVTSTWCILAVAGTALGSSESSTSANSSSADSSFADSTSGDSTPVPPAHSMHRLVSSVLDDVAAANHSETDAKVDPPFLPSAPVPFYRSAEPDDSRAPVPSYRAAASTSEVPAPSYKSASSGSTNSDSPTDSFSPSYFLGEVFEEPYIPERFHSARSDKNSSKLTLTHQLPPSKPAASRQQPSHKRGGSFFPASSAGGDGGGGGVGYHVPPVHEESAEDDYKPSCCGPVTFDEVSSGPQADDLPPKWRPPQHPRGRDHPYPFDSGHPDAWTASVGGASSGEVIVPPPPFYPREPDYPHSGVHYKVYQHPGHFGHHPSPLKGLLHAAAALLPVGLLVASLYPSVLHVNASGMPVMNYRSLDGGGPPLMDQELCDRHRRALCEQLRERLPTVDVELRASVEVDSREDVELWESAKAGLCNTLRCQNAPLTRDQT